MRHHRHALVHARQAACRPPASQPAHLSVYALCLRVYEAGVGKAREAQQVDVALVIGVGARDKPRKHPAAGAGAGGRRE